MSMTQMYVCPKFNIYVIMFETLTMRNLKMKIKIKNKSNLFI